MSGVKETLCTRCAHHRVCKYIEDMQRAIKMVDQSEHGELIYIDVKCRMYKESNQYQTSYTLRDGKKVD